MVSIGVVAVIVLGCFAFVLMFGAPYLPTLSKQTETALELLDLKKGQTVLELGCGDGRVLLAAAKKGIHGVGYELNPLLAGVAWLVTWRYRKKVKIIWGNYWRATWPPADGIFVFLLDKYMKKLDKTIVQSPIKPIKLVSFAFKIPGRKPDKQVGGIYLYSYK